jgi:hypothetical protein
MAEGQATSDKRQLNSLVWAAQPQGSGLFLSISAGQIVLPAGAPLVNKEAKRATVNLARLHPGRVSRQGAGPVGGIGKRRTFGWHKAGSLYACADCPLTAMKRLW